MKDNELLLAISNLLDSKLDPINDKINQMSDKIIRIEDRLSNVEDRLSNVEDRLSNVEDKIIRMDNRLSDVEGRLTNVEGKIIQMNTSLSRVEDKIIRIELMQENDLLPRLQNIESCYTSTYERYKNSVSDYGAMQQDITIMKQVITEHSEKLHKIS